MLWVERRATKFQFLFLPFILHFLSSSGKLKKIISCSRENGNIKTGWVRWLFQCIEYKWRNNKSIRLNTTTTNNNRMRKISEKWRISHLFIYLFIYFCQFGCCRFMTKDGKRSLASCFLSFSLLSFLNLWWCCCCQPAQPACHTTFVSV